MYWNTILEFINKSLSQYNYRLIYEETKPSSDEDLYEVEFWLEDRKLNRTPYSKIFIRNQANYKTKAFEKLLSQMIFAYYERLINEIENN